MVWWVLPRMMAGTCALVLGGLPACVAWRLRDLGLGLGQAPGVVVAWVVVEARRCLPG